MDAATLVGLLADPTRLKVVAALALGADTIADVARDADVPLKDVALAARRLARNGLVRRDGHRLELLADVFQAVARAAAESVPPPERLSDDPEPRRVGEQAHDRPRAGRPGVHEPTVSASFGGRLSVLGPPPG